MAIDRPKFPKWDKRLLGVWKSDRKRTFKEWTWTKKLTPKKKRFFKSLFGKLEVTYTRGKNIQTLRYRRFEYSRRYFVVAIDEDSVAIVIFGKKIIKNRRNYDPENLKMAEAVFPPKPAISHIHFEKDHFWIPLGNGKNREYFRKAKSAH
jgi:hypothetical protein